MRLTARLDQTSRHALVRFALALVSVSGVAFLPVLSGTISLADGFGALSTYCTLTAIIKFVLASFHRSKPGAPSLTEWDESLALIATSSLAHMASGLLR